MHVGTIQVVCQMLAAGCDALLQGAGCNESPGIYLNFSITAVRKHILFLLL
jgi:hypothetical protein